MNMMWFMPSCREVTGLLAEGELENAPRLRRLMIRMHLSMCVHCSRFARQLELIAKALREHWTRQTPFERMEALKRRIIARLGTRGG